MAVSDEILALYRDHGSTTLEGMSLHDAALEAAYLAESFEAHDSLILAVLMRDIGYLVADAATIEAKGHDVVGSEWLAQYFGPAITEPIRLHVGAKRYLCTQASHYKTRLSKDSRKSLDLQGGLMTQHELAEFSRNRYFIEALKLRRWVDAARVPGIRVPGFEHYRARIDAAVRQPALTVA